MAYQRIAHVAIVVRDYDEAISYYTDILGFDLIEDTRLDEKKRWVLVAPPGSRECSILLAKAADDDQATCIGKQTGGRVGFFLFTDDFERDYDNLVSKGVHFVRLPATYDYGKVAVFADLYGNLWDLLEPSKSNKGVRP